MKHLAAAICLSMLSSCGKDDTPGAFMETSPGGIGYARLFMPEEEDVVIQIAWPSDWTRRDGVNQAVPYLGADLILAGGAEGFPPGEVTEIFADIDATGSLWLTADHLHGELVVPTEDLARAVEIAQAHLATPTLDPDWLERLRQDLVGNVTEANTDPATLGFDVLMWAILGDTPLRRFLSIDPPEIIGTVSREDVIDWHARTLTRNGATIVIAGQIDAETAGDTIDALLAGLPEASAEQISTPPVNFAPRRILLHRPEAATTTLIMIGPLPPTREGGEFEDVLLATALGGNDNSVLFDAIRSGLRASYAFSAGLDGFTRDQRFLVLSGEIDTPRLAEAETTLRNAYAGFLAAPSIGDLAARKAPFIAGSAETASDPVWASYSALMAILDGQDPGVALALDTVLDTVTEGTIAARAASAFPAVDDLIVVAVSPDGAALPDACVIHDIAMAAECP